jgi:hypothetical protein
MCNQECSRIQLIVIEERSHHKGLNDSRWSLFRTKEDFIRSRHHGGRSEDSNYRFDQSDLLSHIAKYYLLEN